MRASARAWRACCLCSRVATTCCLRRERVNPASEGTQSHQPYLNPEQVVGRSADCAVGEDAGVAGLLTEIFEYPIWTLSRLWAGWRTARRAGAGVAELLAAV